MRVGAVAILVALAIGASYRTLRARAPQPEPPSDTRSVWDGVFTEEQAQRGEPLYRANCASCHGDTLKGSGRNTFRFQAGLSWPIGMASRSAICSKEFVENHSRKTSPGG